MDRSKTIVWFRRDLRIEDNPALAAAARDGCVFPVFIWCPKEEGQFYPGRVSRWWLKQSLAHLGQSLKSLGAELVLIKTHSTVAALLDCIETIGATRVVFNHLYGMLSFFVSLNMTCPNCYWTPRFTWINSMKNANVWFFLFVIWWTVSNLWHNVN